MAHALAFGGTGVEYEITSASDKMYVCGHMFGSPLLSLRHTYGRFSNLHTLCSRHSSNRSEDQMSHQQGFGAAKRLAYTRVPVRKRAEPSPVSDYKYNDETHRAPSNPLFMLPFFF